MGRSRFIAVRRRLAPFFLPALLASIVAVGCGSDASSQTGPDLIEQGNPDRPTSSTLEVDEAGILAAVEGSTLSIAIPVKSRTSLPALGIMRVALRTLDGAVKASHITVPYSVPPGAKSTIVAPLPVPADVKSQADFVRYVLRLDEDRPDGILVNTSLLRVVAPYEVRLEGPSSARKERTSAWRVRTQNPFTRQPIGGQQVALKLLSGESEVQTLTQVTNATGDAVFELAVAEPGAYTLAASVPDKPTVATLQSGVQIDEVGPKVLLTTDKPIYQPGQLIHLRMLVLDRQGNTPVAGQPTTFELRDGKGNKLLKRAGKTDAWGIASTEFRLGSVLNQGDFKVTAISGSTQIEKTVKVSTYVLPKFKADLTTDKTWYLPGQKVTGLVDADYFFGKPVAGGDVQIEAATLDVGETIFQNVQGKTDSTGRFPFEISLPSSLVGLPLENGNAAVVLRAIVTDTAGQQVKKEAIVVVSQDGLDVVLVPESTSIVPQVDNQLDLFLVDPAGAPVSGAHVKLAPPDGVALEGDTDVYGYAPFTWNPAGHCDTGCSIEAQVGTGNGKTISRSFTFGAQAGKQHVLVRTDRAVYSTGDLVDIEVRGSSAGGHVYLDWINNGQTVDMRTLPIDNGVAKFQASLDNGKLGANRIQAYLVDDDGNVIRAGRTIFVRNAGALSINLSTDKPQYAPGEPAKLTFSVKDENGAPAVAALGVQIVDEAVFALVDAQPGLLRTYFEIESAFSKPQYEIHGPSGDLSQLVFDGTTSADGDQAAAAQKKTAATLAAMGETAPTGISLGTWARVLQDSGALLSPYYQQFRTALEPSIEAIAKEQREALAATGCTAQQYWCDGQSASYYDLILKGIASRLKIYDYWGNLWRAESPAGEWALRLKTDGPDEKTGTADDGMISYMLWDIGAVSDDGWGPNAGTSGAAGAAQGMGGSSAAGSAGSGASGSDQPRVRKYFPETLYVNPALISGPDGLATVEVPMADSITTWRVSSLANAASGKLGGGLAGVTVFQDFFADIDFPATLTRGDEVQFPITVYNYLTDKQTVSLQLEAGDWYTALGQTSATLEIGPGEVVGVRFPVRVEKVGLQSLTVTAKGSKLSDAVQRTVRVEPGGKAFPSSVSGAIGAGELTRSVSFPTGAIPGSSTLHLNVFPAYLAQVVQGMDSLLQVPSGCFEQTTSTTWPNVLVTRYMTQTQQITPEIQMKADSMISAGYQRLLTFEHPGGGFSWFGTQDGHPYLSVTAFGVMEFADMKEVHTVDEAMLQRTVDWLVAQQKGDGSWEGDQTEFFSFQTSTVRNTAFVMWALGVAGYQGAAGGSALGYLKANAKVGEQDSYTLALLANALQLVAPNDGLTTSVFDRIEATKKTEGAKIYWDSSGTQTDFYGSGDDANVASTAMIVEALLRRGGAPDLVKGGMEYLLAARDAQGNFGSTQATIWTLRALLMAATKGTEGAVGTLQVSLDGAPYATLNLTADQSDVMNTVDFGSFATAGDHEVKLAFVGSGKASWHLVSKYNLPWDQSPAEPPGPISVTVGYDKTDLALNETVTATVQITNNTPSEQNMVLVTLGIPPGFQVMGDDFAPYLSSNAMSNWETTGKQLTLYLPKLAPSSSQTITYRLLATMPVTASDGGGQAYPYYEPDAKSSVASTTFHVAP